MPIDAILALDKTVNFPRVKTALAEFIGTTLSRKSREPSSFKYGAAGVNSDVIIISIYRRRDYSDQ